MQVKRTKRAKADGERMYDVTIDGLYAAAGKQKGDKLRHYEVTFPMKQKHVDKGVLFMFRKHYAATVVKKKYPDFDRLNTFNVVRAVPRDGEEITDIQLLNEPELRELIEEEFEEIKHSLYKDAGSLRAAIREFHEDRKGFIERQEMLIGQGKEEAIEDRAEIQGLIQSEEGPASTEEVDEAASAALEEMVNDTAEEKDPLAGL